MDNTLVQHNIPLAVANPVSPLMKDLFPDSDIAKEYASASSGWLRHTPIFALPFVI